MLGTQIYTSYGDARDKKRAANGLPTRRLRHFGRRKKKSGQEMG